jgi:hypothetical protein
MGKPALSFADLLYQTGRQHKFVRHVKKSIFDRRTSTVKDKNLHYTTLSIADLGLQIADCEYPQIWNLDFGFWIKKHHQIYR